MLEPVDARAVANIFFAKGMNDGLLITPMKLLKLTYVAHGWVLGLIGSPLIKQNVEAWKYGPAIRDVYESFKRFGVAQVDTPAIKLTNNGWSVISAGLTKPISMIVDKTWDLYREFSGLQLSAIAHAEGTPWAIVTRGRLYGPTYGAPIPNGLIRKHYRNLALKRIGG